MCQGHSVWNEYTPRCILLRVQWQEHWRLYTIDGAIGYFDTPRQLMQSGCLQHMVTRTKLPILQEVGLLTPLYC